MSGLHLFGLNCQTRSDHMYCIFLSKLIGCSDTSRSASSLWFSSSSCNVQTMLLNPKSPYLGVGWGVNTSTFCGFLKYIWANFLILIIQRETMCVAQLRGKPPQIGHQACKPAFVQFTASAHAIHQWFSTETLLIQSWSEKESIKPPIHVAVSLRIIFATIRRVCLVKYLLDSIQQEGMLIFSTLPLTHIMWPGDCDIPGWRFDVTGALTCPLIQPASCP